MGTFRARIHSIDILRGLVMIIMALDHTRDFFHITAMTQDPLDPATTTVPLYFTRWITHFCAPVFVFLSGVSAYLSSQQKTPAEASIFLIKRGFWLVLIEVTVVTFGITFNPFYNFFILQVIWAIGWSMVITGLLVRFSYKAVLLAGLIIFLGHNITDYLSLPNEGAFGYLMRILLTSRGGVIPLDSSHFVGVFYAILPWTGLMCCGYAAGKFYERVPDAERRRKILMATGAGLFLLFVLLRLINGYGDPVAWKRYPNTLQDILSFFNTTKYPPSLMYLCMIMGPGIFVLGLLEHAKAGWTHVISVYGKVPFFYYILHFYLIHLLCVLFFFATGHSSSEAVDPNVPFLFRPLHFGYGLPVVYLVWIFVVAVLYIPCKRFSVYKSVHRQWWLSYV